MPGRGTPWRKGKGKKGRVAEHDIEDDSIESIDIKDGTIQEVDLDSALQAKVNSGGGHTIQDEGTPLVQRGNLNFVGAGVVASDGVEDTTTVTITGGGGGSNNLEAETVFEFDFFDNGNSNDLSYFGVLGNGSAGGTNFAIQARGILDLAHDFFIIGELWGIDHAGNNGAFESFDFTGSNCTGKFGLGFNALTNMSAFVGFVDASVANLQNPASIAQLETPFNEGAYFRWHSTTSGNWFAVTMTGGVKTETDTGVTVVAGSIINLKIVSTSAINVVFSINGSTVATHTTNLPATDLGLILGGANLSASNSNGDATNPHAVDYIQVQQPR